MYIFLDIRRSPLLSCIRPQETHTAASASSPFLQKRKKEKHLIIIIKTTMRLNTENAAKVWSNNNEQFFTSPRLVSSLNGTNLYICMWAVKIQNASKGIQINGGRQLRICEDSHKVTAPKVHFKESFYTR